MHAMCQSKQLFLDILVGSHLHQQTSSPKTEHYIGIHLAAWRPGTAARALKDDMTNMCVFMFHFVTTCFGTLLICKVTLMSGHGRTEHAI